MKQEDHLADAIRYATLSTPNYSGYLGTSEKHALEAVIRKLEAEEQIRKLEAAEQIRRQVKIAQHVASYPKSTATKPPSPGDFTTPDLIMELLSRGFAVMKLPEDGGFPEAIR